jgi:hypothetical protein
MEERFEPEYQTLEIEVLDELNKCKLDDEKDNIDDWFAQLIYLKQRAKTIKLDISDNQIIAHVLNNLPAAYKEYKAVLLKQARDQTLSLTKMRELLCTAHKQKFGENSCKSPSSACQFTIFPFTPFFLFSSYERLLSIL